ncbi:hypothetical protein ACLI4Q_20255 [Natrialbaceae archaeon A-CW1-1]
MNSNITRRTLVGCVGTTIISGCLGEGADNSSNSQQPDESEEEDDSVEQEQNDTESDEDLGNCWIETMNRRGRADPVETSVEVDQTDDLEEECARTAAEVALKRMDDHSDLKLTDPRPDWIYPSRAYTSDGYEARIVVEAVKNSDGDYVMCPPEEYEMSDAIELIPSEVTVTLQPNEEGEPFTCTHEITLRQMQVSED